MSETKIEIKVLKDSKNKDVDLSAMTLEAASSFLILFESLTRIIQLTPDNKGITIQITSGSAVVAAEGKKVANAKIEFEKVLDNESTDKELVDQWKRIQSVFNSNGLEYEANFYEKGVKTSFYNKLKSHQKLRTKRIKRKKFDSEIEFITAKLIEVGGKKPNIHIEVDGKTLPPISCTEINAVKANRFLYQTIRLSAWATAVNGGKRYVLCDSYPDEVIYNELQSFVKELVGLEQVEALKRLHYQCRYYMDNQNYGMFRKFLRLFSHESTEINAIKMILIVTQSVRDHERLAPFIQKLEELFDKKFKELSKTIF